ncbi:hypothetical protein RHMOL_Rhmol01G0083800 [Rhododendron molle]|uniref:Uncharacterized protein n=1 Tax=Rhododendron molle TaxID=49168 RepID=A0ACC0PZW4_RHOML|nr:hypothetical protein RHMOL_Rhmol01G0083800 [Rhododendron molle]
MDSSCRIRVTTTTTTSPKAGKGSTDHSAVSPSQKGGQCLCSPTTHKGSFRCRFHRSTTTSPPPPWFKRSKSMPPDRSVENSLSPKSADS